MGHVPKHSSKVVKCLGDTRRKNLDKLENDNDVLAIAPKTRWMKETIDKLGFIKMKNFCSNKDTVKRMRRLGENIYKRHI